MSRIGAKVKRAREAKAREARAREASPVAPSSEPEPEPEPMKVQVCREPVRPASSLLSSRVFYVLLAVGLYFIFNLILWWLDF